MKHLFLFFLLFSPLAQSAYLRSSCYLENRSGAEVQGVQIDRRYEIASVSKIMTVYWGIRKQSSEGRFKTKLTLIPVENSVFDVSLQGGSDPYMGAQAFQKILSDLALRGVRQIRQISFDEKFKFRLNPTSQEAAHTNLKLVDPTPERVLREFKLFLSNPTQGYAGLVQRAKASGIQNWSPTLPRVTGEPVFRPTSSLDSNAKGSTLIYQSATFEVVAKELNRNSNNYAAHLFFESLGGAEKFQKFILDDLKLTEQDIRFVNGSGDRLDLADGSKVYNEATCRAIIQVVRALQSVLKQEGKSLEHVMAVAGEDFGESRSTTTALYENDTTRKSLVAKTGTVNPSITLAGRMLTEQGEVFFGTVMGTQPSAADWREARYKIKDQVVQLYRKFGGAEELSYQAKAFFPFDQQSSLRESMESGRNP